MTEVHTGLFVGSEADELGTRGASDWFVVHACKEPFHRAALGYKGRAAPKDDPEYLVAYRPGCAILNLIDAPDPQYIASGAVFAGIGAIADNIQRSNVLVHCNRGASRAPMIALLYLALHTDLFDDCDHDDAAARFASIYPAFAPAGGMVGFARMVWAGETEMPKQAAMPAPDIKPRLVPGFDSKPIFRL